MAFPTVAQEAVLQDVIANNSSALVVSGPGTGKSRIGLELARRKMATLEDNSVRQILFLSFSNAAIQRLARAVGLYFTKRERRHLRFMTFHSCAAELLAQYGRFIGLPPSVHVIDKLDEKLIALELNYDDKDSQFSARLRELARSGGLLSFDVIIPLTVELLKKSPRLSQIVSRSYPLIIVDEFQDTSEVQWHLLKLLGAGAQVVALADPNQIIYSSMHGATQERLKEFAAWKAVNPTTLPPDYHRCSNARILEFADCLLNGRPYTRDFTEGLQQFKLVQRNQLRAYLALIWREIRKQIKPTETIAVLVPTNKLAEDVTVSLRNPPQGSGISFPVYARVSRDEAAYDAVTLALAALHDYVFTFEEKHRNRAALALCALNAMWNSKWKARADAIRKVTVSFEKSEKDQSSSLCRLVSKLKSAGTEHIALGDLVAIVSEMTEFGTMLKRIEAHFDLRKEKLSLTPAQPSLFDKCRSERAPKGLYGHEATGGQTQILTYHKAKGREFDFVLMVVEPRGESTKPPIDESRRLYYVCTTRPKRWLGILHFSGNPGRVLAPVLSL